MGTVGLSIEETLESLDDNVRDMLCEDLPAQFDAVTKALKDRNWSKAQQCAHDVNGTASFCRLEMLRQAALDLEQALLNPPPDEAIHERFHAAASEARAVIQRWLDK